MKRAIVLSGGGARGAYQVGVWKGLKKLNIKYDIVTGTSIGSINGLMMVQQEYLKTLWWWINISFDDLYDDKFPTQHETMAEMVEIYKNYIKHFFKEGGIKTTKMSSLLNRIFNWNKFSRSKIDYGLITYNLTKAEPLCIQKKDLTKEKIISYVMASACCYPAFQKMEINGDKYIDGGYYDNMPINLAIDMGAEEIIAVDLEALGVKKPVKNTDIKIKYIKPRNDIGSILVFDKQVAMRSIRFGYYDVMKEYHKLDGNKYTFKHNHLDKNFNKYYQKFINNCEQVFNYKGGVYEELLKLSLFSRILKSKQKYEIKKIMNETVEFLGTIFKTDDCQLYDIHKFNKLLIQSNKSKEQISKEFIQEKIKKKEFKELFNTSSIVKYLYNLLNNSSNNKELCAIALIFPKEFIGAIYLKTIQ